ncbi:MAG TPA: hypothetical protein VHB21_20960, partial [Minicystis sp.]|nr:hypothetical protein [Minicystis sp.]
GVLTAPGIGGPPVWAMPGVLPDGRPAPAPTTTPSARPVERDIAGRLLREDMHAKDKAKGFELPAAGTAATAVQASLYASDLPAAARGTIAVQLDAAGNVTGVKVVSSVGGTADQWERAAQAAAARLRAQKLQMPDTYKKGAIVFIDASSVSQLPAGGKGGLEGAGARFDLSNIGAHARQVVRVATRVVAVR